MTDATDPQRDSDNRPMGTAGDFEPDDAAEEARRRGLPEHEIDEDATVGGGMMSQGGTAIDRGTGTLSGQAQGERDEDADGGDVRPDAGV